VNKRRARELQGVLSTIYEGADVTVDAEPDGAKIVISGIRSAGATQPGTDQIRFSVRPGSPVLRLMLGGHV
jgi:hypothetical protein